MWWPAKAFFALLARIRLIYGEYGIWFHIWVSLLMLLAIWRAAKALTAMFACIWLHSCVSSFMFLAISKLGKALCTILAWIRLLSCVNSFMFLAMWRPAKALIAIFACMRFHFCVYTFRASYNLITGQRTGYSACIRVPSHVSSLPYSSRQVLIGLNFNPLQNPDIVLDFLSRQLVNCALKIDVLIVNSWQNDK